jgi:hypothetical protein
LKFGRQLSFVQNVNVSLQCPLKKNYQENDADQESNNRHENGITITATTPGTRVAVIVGRRAVLASHATMATTVVTTIIRMMLEISFSSCPIIGTSLGIGWLIGIVVGIIT